MIRTTLYDLAYNSRIGHGAFDTILVKPTSSDKRFEKAQNARIEFSQVTFLSDFTGLMGVGRKKFGKWEVEYNGLAFMVEVVVGINVNDPHTNLKGENDCTMGELLHSLNYYGYDPLFSIKNREYHDAKQHELAKFVLSDLKRQRAGDFKSSHHTITERVRRWARSIRDDARDYVRGETADPKMFLDERTIRNRKYKQSHYNGVYGRLYQAGLNEALWESGRLEMSIEVLSVRIVKRFEKMSQADKNRKAYHKRYDKARYSPADSITRHAKQLKADEKYAERKAKKTMEAAMRAASKVPGGAKIKAFWDAVSAKFGSRIGKTDLAPYDWILTQINWDKDVQEFVRQHGYDENTLPSDGLI